MWYFIELLLAPIFSSLALFLGKPYIRQTVLYVVLRSKALELSSGIWSLFIQIKKKKDTVISSKAVVLPSGMAICNGVQVRKDVFSYLESLTFESYKGKLNYNKDRGVFVFVFCSLPAFLPWKGGEGIK